MACAISVPKPTHPPITICPPGSAANARLDLHIGMRAMLPVSVRFAAGGEVESTGLDFSDYSRMGRMFHKLDSGRLSDTPSWATNDKQLRAVLVVYMERRAGLMEPGPGTEIERLLRAQKKLTEGTASLQATLDKMVHRYAEVLAWLKQNPADAEALDARHECAVQIKNLDTVLLFNKDIAGKVLRVVHCYYRLGYTSVQVETETGLKPTHVRELIFRLRKVAASLGFTNPPVRRHKRVIYSKPRVCIECGAPRGKGYKFCDACSFQRAQRSATVSPASASAPKKISIPPTLKRQAIVSSPEFIALFEAARARMKDPNRATCKRGHPICAANAHVGDLRRIGKYSCDPCWKEQQGRYLTSR
jgi:hypothetical protein